MVLGYLSPLSLKNILNLQHLDIRPLENEPAKALRV